ncbi:GNAT family N-acetyltransferase [Xanthomonas euroxanthea]|uniref:GNAT family N-acetyltransferase n=1 Tax=Xanthomonas euroxanthea TaxID=2259622 RepID=UPI003CCD678C
MAAVDPSHRRRGLGQQGVQVCIERHVERFGLQRQLPQQPRRHVQQRRADAGMSNEENATGHAETLTGRHDRAIASAGTDVLRNE